MSAVSDTIHPHILRSEIVAQLDTGALPRAGGERIFAGFGDDRRCDCCGRPIGVRDVLYEVELQQHAVAGCRPLAMHLRCFDVWVEASQLSRSLPPPQRPRRPMAWTE
jgi:hypothetical protein